MRSPEGGYVIRDGVGKMPADANTPRILLRASHQNWISTSTTDVPCRKMNCEKIYYLTLPTIVYYAGSGKETWPGNNTSISECEEAGFVFEKREPDLWWCFGEYAWTIAVGERKREQGVVFLYEVPIHDEIKRLKNPIPLKIVIDENSSLILVNNEYSILVVCENLIEGLQEASLQFADDFIDYTDASLPMTEDARRLWEKLRESIWLWFNGCIKMRGST